MEVFSKFPSNLYPNPVTDIACNNNYCDMFYIWGTSKQVKLRAEEHRKNITQHHQLSLIYQHIAQVHHVMNWNNVSILNKHQNTYSRKFLEACHTQDMQAAKFQQIYHIPPISPQHIHNNNYYAQHSWKFCPLIFAIGMNISVKM